MSYQKKDGDTDFFFFFFFEKSVSYQKKDGRPTFLWYDSLSEQLAHSAVDLHLKEISEFPHGSEMNKTPTLPWPLQIAEWASFVQLDVWHRPPTVIGIPTSHSPFSLNCVLTDESAESTPEWAVLTQCKFLLHLAVHMRYKSYTRDNRSTYTHKIQPLRIRPIETIASESVITQDFRDLFTRRSPKIKVAR